MPRAARFPEGSPLSLPADDAALATARRVLRTEGAAVLALADALPEDFLPAVRLLLDTRGRVILSGIGKSGHIARKIAATLSSTGTPAYFVHPAEASHGDLGTITPEDCLILLSNSGESAELGDLIAHARRFGIALIGISSGADSTLMAASDIRLLLPHAPEACTIGMVPTTSTTMALALGDALAVALMEVRGFAREAFRAFHPGGTLGARLARVGQLMRTDRLPLVGPGAPMAEVILTMTERGYGVAGLVDEGRLIGVITDGDLRRNMEGLLTRTAGQVATRAPASVPADMLAVEAVALMNARKVTVLFVVTDAGAVLGVLHIQDCLRAGVV